MNEFCEFLRKAGQTWTKLKPETTFKTLRPGFAVMETSLRKYLARAGANLGERILEEAEPKMDAKTIAAINKEAQSQPRGAVQI